MALAALIGAALLWLTFGGKILRDRRNWPAIAAMLLGLLLLGDGRAITGLAFVAGGALWLRKPWTVKRRPAPSSLFAQDMALAEARDLLGLPAGADRAEIIAAHRRLIARNHPDSGGTEALAARLNAARDLLLQQKGP